MGQRVFYQQMLSDSLHGADGRVSDEIDVVTLKDYMQVSFKLFLDFFSFDVLSVLVFEFIG